MNDSRIRAAEQTTLSLRRAEARTIAFAAPEPGSGTSAFAALAAAILARSGQPTLLIDISRTAQDPAGEATWTPGQEEAKIRAPRTEADFARLTVQAGPDVRFLFDNIEWFRSVLDTDLSSYDYIVLDLAPLFDRLEDTVNPFAAAAACDALVLVCRRGGVTKERLRNAVDMARATGCRPFGIVMTQGGYATPGEEIARNARKLFFFAPWFAKWIGRKARSSEILS
jgi:Mrp family chromosome partitioning ATPase